MKDVPQQGGELFEIDLRTLMNRMGHKTAKLALEVYAKADPVADRAAADTIGGHVLGAMSHMERTVVGDSQIGQSEL